VAAGTPAWRALIKQASVFAVSSDELHSLTPINCEIKRISADFFACRIRETASLILLVLLDNLFEYLKGLLRQLNLVGL